MQCKYCLKTTPKSFVFVKNSTKICQKKFSNHLTSTGLSFLKVKFIVRFSMTAIVPKSSWPLNISGR